MQQNQVKISQIDEQIFNFISDLLSSEDFKQAQAEFFDKNCQHFIMISESESENKHEHFKIFKEYALILDESIESQLMTKFSESEISNFFATFEQNYKQFDNQDLVDDLFSFTDFEKFKELMLIYNKKNLNVKPLEEPKSVQIQNHFTQDFDFYKKYLESDLKNKKMWSNTLKAKKKDNDNEVHPVLYTTPFEKTGLDLLRSEVVLKNVSLEAVKQTMIKTDFDELQKTQKVIREAKIVKRLENDGNIVYLRLNLPVISDRDMLVQTSFRTLSNGILQVCQNTTEVKEYPERKGIVRVSSCKHIWLSKIPNSNHTQMTSIEHTDLRGYIPKVFLNMMMSKQGKQMLTKFHEQCSKTQKAMNEKQL